MPKVTDLDISRFEVGQIAFLGMATLPFGALLCDGSVVSRTTYAKLFAKIGTTFNTGGELGTEFRLPDLRSRTPVGAGTGSGLTTRVMGQSFGEETHALTVGEMPAHFHPSVTDYSGAHQHSYQGPVPLNNLRDDGGFVYAGYQDSLTGVSGGHVHNVTFNDTGSGVAHNNMAPCLVGMFVIAFK